MSFKKTETKIEGGFQGVHFDYLILKGCYIETLVTLMSKVEKLVWLIEATGNSHYFPTTLCNHNTFLSYFNNLLSKSTNVHLHKLTTTHTRISSQPFILRKTAECSNSKLLLFIWHPAFFITASPAILSKWFPSFFPFKPSLALFNK